MKFSQWIPFALLTVCASGCLDIERTCRDVPAETELDWDGDGLVDRFTAVIYDEDGLSGLSETSEGEDLGLVISRVHLTLNDARLRIIEEFDDPVDGSINLRRSYSYAEHDKWTEQREDEDGDGVDDSSMTRTFDQDGNELLWEVDSDNDGTVDTRWNSTYDAEGRLVRREHSDAGSGVVDFILTNNYDTPGLVLGERDEGADGTIDYRAWNYLNSEGHTDVSETDNDADGELDYRHTYTYDADENMTVHVRDAIYEGEVSFSTRTTYTYDARGNRLVREEDQGDDGVINSRSVTNWQCI